MIFGFWKKQDDQRNAYKERVWENVEYLNQGKQNYLAPVYQALASNDKEIVEYASWSIANYLKGMNAFGLIRLDEQFRQCSSLEWYYDWGKCDLQQMKRLIGDPGNYLWVVRLGTFHPDGIFREKCIRELIGEKESLGFLLLRLNDWAEPVRRAAESGCKNINGYNSAELVSVLPFLEKVSQGYRKDRAFFTKLRKTITDKILEELGNVDLHEIGKYDLRTRKYLYHLLLENRSLNKEEMIQILSAEKSSECQRLILMSLFEQFDFSIQELNVYLNHKSKMVRKKALEYKYRLLGDYWDGLEKMLLEKSAGVRGTVRFILRKHTQFDIISYYVQHLESPHKKICILGIGENGTEKDAELIMEYLQDTDEGIVKNTLHAIGLLLKEKADEIFWKYLQDERPIVMRQANREIIAHHIKYGAKQVYDLLVQTESILLKEKLSCQLLRESSWDRMPYVLMLYSCEDETVRDIARRGIEGRYAYAKISREKADWIKEILQDSRYQIPSNIQKSILFDLKFIVKDEV